MIGEIEVKVTEDIKGILNYLGIKEIPDTVKVTKEADYHCYTPPECFLIILHDGRRYGTTYIEGDQWNNFNPLCISFEDTKLRECDIEEYKKYNMWGESLWNYAHGRKEELPVWRIYNKKDIIEGINKMKIPVDVTLLDDNKEGKIIIWVTENDLYFDKKEVLIRGFTTQKYSVWCVDYETSIEEIELKMQFGKFQLRLFKYEGVKR